MQSDDRPTLLRQPTKHGVYLRWPLDGTDWIHPDDVDAVCGVIPSRRVWRRDDVGGDYVQISYGDQKFRVQPTMWLEIEDHGYLIGDRVEVKSDMGKRPTMIATIRDILWDVDSGQIEYHLHHDGREPPERPFHVDEFQIARRLGQPLTWRERQLLSRSRVR